MCSRNDRFAFRSEPLQPYRSQSRYTQCNRCQFSNSRFYHSVAGQTGQAAIGFREGFALFWALGLICLNSYICGELFCNPTAFMNSMHGFWVALARHGGYSWFQPNWWPYWDCGMLFEFTGAPLIPAATRTWAAFSATPHALALQSITGVVYCLVPVTLFVMCWRLTGRPATPSPLPWPIC